MPRTFTPLPSLVGPTRVHNSCVCDLCRVRGCEVESRPSVVTAPEYRGCPAGTHWCDPVSKVRPDQSANSCCACWCVVVRRTRRRVVSVESPDVTFVAFLLTPLLDMVTDPSSTWLRLWPCRSSGKPRTRLLAFLQPLLHLLTYLLLCSRRVCNGLVCQYLLCLLDTTSLKLLVDDRLQRTQCSFHDLHGLHYWHWYFLNRLSSLP